MSISSIHKIDKWAIVKHSWRYIYVQEARNNKVQAYSQNQDNGWFIGEEDEINIKAKESSYNSRN